MWQSLLNSTLIVAKDATMATVSVVLGPLLHNKFLIGLAKSFGVILASEIGDKTFFIAAIMAMRNPRMTVGSLASRQP